MKRFNPEQGENIFGGAVVGEMHESPKGRFVQYKEARQIETDRDIKAANMQLLVEKVLMWAVQDSAFQVAPELQAEFNETMAFARGLKQ
jgi:hypothetical protein